jgi:hypothetical protein
MLSAGKITSHLAQIGDGVVSEWHKVLSFQRSALECVGERSSVLLF